MQEQVIVHGIPQVHAGMPVSSTFVQEQVIVHEIQVVTALAHVQEQVNVHEIPEVQAVTGSARGWLDGGGVAAHPSAHLGAHSSSSTSSACGLRYWVDDEKDEVWTLLTDAARGSWWLNLNPLRSQWGQGLGIHWSLLECPCRLRGRFNILESMGGWGPLVMQRQVPLQRSSAEALEAFHLLSTRSWTLDFYFYEPRASGSTRPGAYVSLRLLSEEFQTPVARRGNLDIISTSPSFSAGVSLLCNAWLDSGYMSCVSSRVLLDVSPTFSM